mmetsp:Transcript_15396/g.10783  ORF Transcript_15396/g.10783 Transcript_15396/m.10783 type:complete len:117 (+) Transcript_15396:257-607(+)|eukprot:CAMPEP_0116870548 /NCGR_PEP_ID=MMETSP0463-20121206/482_1 /TAXON_ID=181622 /ORGANISM="Strombidinopsis sp, Strain SopsisLIS2011" /LENGTH=116 /DNA_ID=CAMNT_0004507247 /DNA_START=255 /DNA_END=605 /DNA_ORIENTATION=-
MLSQIANKPLFPQILLDQEEEIKDGDNNDYDTPRLDSEIDFYDAIDDIQKLSMRKSTHLDDVLQDESQELSVRMELPWLKDPNMKISIWSIIKDSIGKDISRITVPVFFNDPTNIL